MTEPALNFERVLVTGAAGFIGSAIVRNLLESGIESLAEVVAFDSLIRTGSWRNLSPVLGDCRLRMHVADVRDSLALRRACEGVSLVIHAAALSSVDDSFAYPLEYAAVNSGGTLNLLRAAVAARVSTLVHISTDEVYGPCLSGTFDESTGFAPTNPYALSKATAEHHVRDFMGSNGMTIFVLRPSNNYGLGQMPDNLIPKFATMLALGERAPLYGSGEQRRCWTYVDDTYRAIMRVLGAGVANSVYNISGEELTNREVVSWILQSLDLGWDRIDEVEGRPVHDDRYCNDDTALRALGYTRLVRLKDMIEGLVSHYADTARFEGETVSTAGPLTTPTPTSQSPRPLTR